MDGEADALRLWNRSVEGGGGTVKRFEIRLANALSCGCACAYVLLLPLIEGAVGGRRRTNLLDCCAFGVCCWRDCRGGGNVERSFWIEGPVVFGAEVEVEPDGRRDKARC